MSNPISDTGITVVYAPEEGSPLLDIVIVHGLQGHPYKTWASTKTAKVASSTHQSSLEVSQDARRSHTSILRRISSKVSAKSSGKVATSERSSTAPLIGNTSNNSGSVFWPRDLAPKDCPRSRILVFGYDTKVSKYLNGSTNKSHVLSHGKDLLFEIGRRRPLDRPLIFLAHSLGGIVVKEALAASSMSADANMKNIVESTAGVIFLGTPHRGSSGLSDLGERARTVLSAFRMETNSAILDTLGLKTSDLERAQESFSRLWYEYDFRVKTFQEGLGLTGVHLGVLGDKVVPDYSSLLGDHRERAETIQANHMEMCRFIGADDPNYCKVIGELRSIYHSIEELKKHKIHQNGLIQHRIIASRCRYSTKEDGDSSDSRSHNVVKALRQKLEFPTMKQRYRSIATPARETCCWLFEHPLYDDWINRRFLDLQDGLLLLQGKPGAGKSVLMKEAHLRISLRQSEPTDIVATFFFNAQGQELEHSIVGMFRSLLYQLLPLYEEETTDLIHILGGDEITPSLKDLQEFFESLYSRPQKRRTIILVDAFDECDREDVRTVASFWRKVTRQAHMSGAQLDVLMSIRHFPHIAPSRCPIIRVDDCNQQDIARYAKQRINLVAIPEETLASLKSFLVKNSRGVFLWAVLMVERMIERWYEGEGLSALLADKAPIPMELDTLFTEILAPVDPEQKQVTIRLFQWASLAVVPLRLHEWHHILAFIRQPNFKSLNDWQMSEYFTENDDQLERLIKSLSRGLLEVRTMPAVLTSSEETMSTKAGAGSLDTTNGETRVVEFIHQSVREFFLHGRGFSALDSTLEESPRAAGHLQIIRTCMDYLDIAELNALVNARFIAWREAEGKALDTFGNEISGGKSDETHDSMMIHDQHPKHGLVNWESQYGQTDLKKSLRGVQLTKLDIDSGELCQEPPTRATHGSEALSMPEPLSKLPKDINRVDVGHWIMSNQLLCRQSSTSEPTHSSSGRPSPSPSTTHLLQAYPALLSYATYKLFTHAKRAQREAADPKAVVCQLVGGSWGRWLLLSEAASPKLELYVFAKKENLDSWFPYLRVNEAVTWVALEKLKLEAYEWQAKRDNSREHWRSQSGYASSVESFGSASSHRSVDFFQGPDIPASDLNL